MADSTTGILEKPETEAFEIPDIPPTITPADTAPIFCQHNGCTNAVTKPARGRTPKYCDEHKPARSTGSRSAISGKTWARAVEIETILSNYVIALGAGIQFVNKTDGEIITLAGPNVVHELVELAKTDTRLRKYLETLATPGKYAPLAMALMGLVLPILANHKMLPQIVIDLTSGKE